MADEPISELRPIVTRPEAQASGSKRYFTGKPCILGHVSERYVANKSCSACLSRWTAPVEKRQSRRKTVYQANKDHEAKLSAVWYRANKARKRQKRAIWYQANFDQIQAVNVAWQKANPEATMSIYRNRRARKAAAGGTHNGDDIRVIFKRQKGKCAHTWCRVNIEAGYHVDHIKPLALNGSNGPKNLQLLCASCNRSKSAIHPIDFAQRHGMLL